MELGNFLSAIQCAQIELARSYSRSDPKAFNWVHETLRICEEFGLPSVLMDDGSMNPVACFVLRLVSKSDPALNFQDLVCLTKAWEYFDKKQKAEAMAGKRPGQVA